MREWGQLAEVMLVCIHQFTQQCTRVAIQHFIRVSTHLLRMWLHRTRQAECIQRFTHRFIVATALVRL